MRESDRQTDSEDGVADRCIREHENASKNGTFFTAGTSALIIKTVVMTKTKWFTTKMMSTMSTRTLIKMKMKLILT